MKRILKAPKGKGYRIYRGDAAPKIRIKKGRMWSTVVKIPSQYKVGKRCPFIGKGNLSWTTDYNIAKQFAKGITEHHNLLQGNYFVPIIVHALSSRIVKDPGFWVSEKEVHTLRGKSRITKVDVFSFGIPYLGEFPRVGAY